jgi:hypothetical protein
MLMFEPSAINDTSVNSAELMIIDYVLLSLSFASRFLLPPTKFVGVNNGKSGIYFFTK